MKKTQKNAVYEVTLEVLTENGVDFVEGDTVVNDIIDKDLRDSIRGKLLIMFKNSEIVLNKSFDDKTLEKYVGSLMCNWFNKDLRLNGNIPHTIKAAGSRIGQTDPVVKELRKMRKAVVNTNHEPIVKQEIIKRQEHLRKEQISKIEINPDLIPEHLQHLLNSENTIQQ